MVEYPIAREVDSTLEEWLVKRHGQEWIRTTEGVKLADLQSSGVPLRKSLSHRGEQQRPPRKPWYQFSHS